MGQILNVSIPISAALASAIRVQKIIEIAIEGIQREVPGALPPEDQAFLEDFAQGLGHGLLVARGPTAARSVGQVLAFLTDLDDPETVRIFYEEADERVGGPIWSIMSDAEHDVLLLEALTLARALQPHWEQHCVERPSGQS